MGCGCGGGGRSYARPAAQTGSQHAPISRTMAQPRVNHAPSSGAPKVVQASALAARRGAVTRRQV